MYSRVSTHRGRGRLQPAGAELATGHRAERRDRRSRLDELYFPTKGWSGLTLRLFDLEKRQWLIYWVSSKTGVLGTPVVGGRDGERGEFYGSDDDDGRAVTVRDTWTKVDQDHARWEQAFSYDGRAWWTN